MPSASAKLEKQASTEASDPLKQILTIVEKKVRNLEKRKAKLDAYKNDYTSGKELNDDQKNAVKKYDQVVEVLDFAKELQKSFNCVVQETVKSQKKAAKREQVERQQQEVQRIREIMLMQDILNSMDGDEVRKDFLNGTNGAVQLTEEELNYLDELYKVACPERNADDENPSGFEHQLIAAAEHIQALLEAKQKEVFGTTYKNLKETLQKIHSCGYFNKSEGQQDDDEIGESVTHDNFDIQEQAAGNADKELSSDVFVEDEFVMLPGVTEMVPTGRATEEDSLKIQVAANSAEVDRSFYQTDNPILYGDQTRPLQDVLPVQGNFNFLQESQIDLESPHMDPAVVVAHPIVASPSIGYPGPQYPSSSQSSTTPTLSSQHSQQRKNEDDVLSGRLTSTRVMPSAVTSTSVQQQAVGSSIIAGPQQLQMQNQVNPPPDFDPARPIPTQTYTNQSFTTAIHPMMAAAAAVVPQNYAPVTIAHATLPPQHIVPSGMVSQSVSPRGTVTPPPVVADPSTLSMTVHNQPSGLSVSSAVSQAVSLNAQQDAKEHFTNREFQMTQQQITLDRESPQSVQSALVASATSQFQQIEDPEGHFADEMGNTFGNNRNARSGARESRNRGSANIYPRGTTQGGYGTGVAQGGYVPDRDGYNAGYQSSNNNQTYVGRDNFTGSPSYSSNLKRGLTSRGASRGGTGARGGSGNARGNRTGGHRNQ